MDASANSQSMQSQELRSIQGDTERKQSQPAVEESKGGSFKMAKSSHFTKDEKNASNKDRTGQMSVLDPYIPFEPFKRHSIDISIDSSSDGSNQKQQTRKWVQQSSLEQDSKINKEDEFEDLERQLEAEVNDLNKDLFKSHYFIDTIHDNKEIWN